MNAWKVYIWSRHFDRWIYHDTVYYTKDCCAEYILNSLINHDDYPTSIKIILDK